jgi:hypothetical protein
LYELNNSWNRNWPIYTQAAPRCNKESARHKIYLETKGTVSAQINRNPNQQREQKSKSCYKPFTVQLHIMEKAVERIQKL